MDWVHIMRAYNSVASMLHPKCTYTRFAKVFMRYGREQAARGAKIGIREASESREFLEKVCRRVNMDIRLHQHAQGDRNDTLG